MKQWAKDQIAAALKTPRAKTTTEPATKRTAPQGDTLLRCCTNPCGFDSPSVKAMDQHCDDAGHHRYEFVLEAVLS